MAEWLDRADNCQIGEKGNQHISSAWIPTLLPSTPTLPPPARRAVIICQIAWRLPGLLIAFHMLLLLLGLKAWNFGWVLAVLSLYPVALATLIITLFLARRFLRRTESDLRAGRLQSCPSRGYEIQVRDATVCTKCTKCGLTNPLDPEPWQQAVRATSSFWPWYIGK